MFNNIIKQPKYIYLLKKHYEVNDVDNNSLNELPFEIKNIIANKGQTHYYLSSLPLTITNKAYHLFKRIYTYTISDVRFELKLEIANQIKNGKYSILYIFKDINKKTISNMENNKVLFIPVRYNDDKTDMGAIISQEALSEYVILSDSFKALEKKSLMEEILELPTSNPILLEISPSE